MSDDERNESVPAPTRRRSAAWLVWVVLLGLVGAYLYANRPVEASFEWKHDLEHALAEAAEEDRMVLVEFQTAGCPGCRWMERNVFNQPEVAEALDGWVPVSIDGNEQTDLSLRYAVEAFPTLVFLAPDGTWLGNFVGTIEADKLIELLKAVETQWREHGHEHAVQTAPATAPE